MKRYRLGIVVLLVTGAVLALSGCGSSGNKRLSKQQFAAKAGALCTTFKQDEKAARKSAGDLANPTPKILTAYLEKTAPLFEQRIADLKKLKPIKRP
jgi:uncharacterized protein YceK